MPQIVCKAPHGKPHQPMKTLGITFNANNKFTERYVYRGNNNQYQESYDYGTYTYNPPVVTLTYNDGYVMVGRIEGNTFTLEGTTLFKK